MTAVSVACAAALVLSACGSDDEDSGDGGGGGGGGGGGNGGSLDVGLLTSLSGPGATAAQGSIRGAQARFDSYEGECSDVEFTIVEADDTSSPQGALAGAQKLVQSDQVDAMINVSAFFYGASQFLTTQAQTVPVIGGAWDGAPEWSATDDNLFNSGLVPDYDTVFTGAGEFYAEQGATKVAGIAYTSPSSQAGLDSGLASMEAAGLEVGYRNDSVQFGSTDVGPLVLGILDSGDDAVYPTINFDTSLALVAGLRQAGWDGVFTSPTGYGSDLLASEPAVAVGQGVIFTNAFTPVELNTPATEELKAALQAQGNESGIPGFYEGQGWFGADLLIHGLEAAGCDATSEEIIEALQSSEDWDANGLYPNPISQTDTSYDEQCSYYVQLENDAFVPLNDGEPYCGTAVE